MERRLAAILAADVVGYSRLVREDEAGTLTALKGHLEKLIEPKIAEHNGRIVKLMGDGLLAEFSSAVEAVQCAVEIQYWVGTRAAEVAEDRRVAYRIGINIGDIVVEGADIYGDGVNVAARLEGLAEPGGICLARNVFNQVKDKLALTMEHLGEREVKNIAEPVSIYCVVLDEQATALVTPVVPKPTKPASRRWVTATAAAAATVLVAAAGGALWWQPWVPDVEPASLERTTLPLPDKPSIAVLPFDNLSGDPKQEWFADGMTDDLITDLSKISGLFVIARNSTFPYKGQKVKVHRVAEELGVRYVLEGSVQRAGDKVRINVQLIDALSGRHLWSERYDGTGTDIFALQDKVIRKIVSALTVELTASEKTQLARKPTENLEAYDYYLRAERSRHVGGVKGNADALANYQKAIALDPRFAEAYAGDARVSVDVWRLDEDFIPAPVARKRAYEAAERALALAPNNARAHSVLSLLQMTDGRHVEAIESARQAVSLNPNNAEALADLAIVLTYAGNHAEAVDIINTAFRLNPNPSPYYLGTLGLVLFFDRQFKRAIEPLEKIRSETSPFWLRELLAMAYAQIGRPEEARAEVEEILKSFPGASVGYFRVLYSYHKLKADLELRLQALKIAGLPDWPFGYELRSEDRLDTEAIKTLAMGSTWAGHDSFNRPFIQEISKDGSVAYRDSRVLLTGKAWVERDSICYYFPGSNVSRQSCHQIYRNSSQTSNTDSEYIAVGLTGIYFFSQFKRP